MKKLLIVLGTLLGLFVVAAIIVPLVVDVDKYRPQIVQAADQQINGKVDLGKLSLSLWGQIRIEVAGLTVSDAAGNKILSVNDAYFHLPFMSILSGSPELTFKMSNPNITVIKDKSGKMNLMSLVKKSTATAAAPSQPSAQTSTVAASSEPVKIPGIAARARLGIEMDHANLVYHDATTALDSKVEDLNILFKDISLSHPTEMEIWANLKTTLGKTFALEGPISLKGRATPTLADGKFDHLDFTATLDANDLEMTAPGLFEKKKGMECNGDLALTASENEVKLDHLKLKFFNATIDIAGNVTHLVAANPLVDSTVKSNEIDFKPWVELVPMLKDYELAGTATLDAQAHGTSDKLVYGAKFKVNALTAKAGNLKAQPKIDALITLAPDRIDNLTLTMKAPGNDLQIHGKLVSFTHPHGDFEVTSSGMDLDQLINFPPEPAKGAAVTNASKQTATADQSKAPASDLDKMLDPLRQNKMMLGAVININTNMKMIKAKNVKITDLVGKLYFNDLTGGLDHFAMKVFGGTIKSSMAAALKPETPTYKFSASVEGLDLAQATESQMPSLKNTVLGKANFSIDGSGSSFNTKAAIANLNAKGNMRIDQAELDSIDVGKMVEDGIYKTVDSVSALKGKRFGNMPKGSGKYEYIQSNFTIAGGKFSAPDFATKAAPNQGIDLKGATTVGMLDYKLDASWEVIDTYNVTKAADISIPSPLGGTINHALVEGSNPFKFPVHASCTLMAPCYSYDTTISYLTKVATNNLTKGTADQAKNQAQQQILKNAPPAAQSAVDALKNKFHF